MKTKKPVQEKIILIKKDAEDAIKEIADLLYEFVDVLSAKRSI